MMKGVYWDGDGIFAKMIGRKEISPSVYFLLCYLCRTKEEVDEINGRKNAEIRILENVYLF